MKCIVLAAGYATRLYPLTKNFPKPLLEVGGKTILDRLLDDIDSHAPADEYIVISNAAFYGIFTDWAEKSRLNVTVLNDGTFTNETRLGAVKDLAFAVESRKIDDDALVIAGDNLTDFSLGLLADYAKKKKASCIMRYYEPDEKKLVKCGVVKVDEDDRILRMTEKSPTPETHWCCPPFYYYVREDLALVSRGIAEGCPFDAPGSFAAWLAERKPVYAMEMPGSRYDVGSLESYEKIKNMPLFN